MININESNNLSRISSKIKIQREEEENGEKRRKEKNDLILFFSFDIVNSTIYKTINYFNWSTVLNALFREIKSKVNKKLSLAEQWRILGDEIIFIISIKKKEEIFYNIEGIYSIMLDISMSLKTGDFFDQIGLSNQDRNLMKLQNVLSLKSSAWIAIIKKETSNSEIVVNDTVENIYIEYNDGPRFFEFLGNDIDAGFRISKQTCDRRLVLSFELAYLLAQKTSYLSKLYIITYKILKGIWNNRAYPIIWYYDQRQNDNVPFEESFYYDEIQRTPLLQEYIENRKENNQFMMPMWMFSDVNKALEKLIQDLNLNQKLEKIQDIIEKNSNDKKYIKSDTFELHIAAICYDYDKKKILIVRRNNKKELFPKKWEFGCAKAQKQSDICSVLVEEYKKDFNIEIEPIIEKDSDDKQPIPLRLYSLDNKGQQGIIVLANVKDASQLKLSSKHCDMMWIIEDDIDKIEDKQAVPDFKYSLRLAFKKFKSIYGE